MNKRIIAYWAVTALFCLATNSLFERIVELRQSLICSRFQSGRACRKNLMFVRVPIRQVE